MLSRLEHLNIGGIGTELRRQSVLSEIGELGENCVDCPGRMIVEKSPEQILTGCMKVAPKLKKGQKNMNRFHVTGRS
jgi:hypothetical protein